MKPKTHDDEIVNAPSQNFSVFSAPILAVKTWRVSLWKHQQNLLKIGYSILQMCELQRGSENDEPNRDDDFILQVQMVCPAFSGAVIETWDGFLGANF
jgi:hypothetical protein